MSQYYLRGTIAKKNTSLHGNDSFDFIIVYFLKLIFLCQKDGLIISTGCMYFWKNFVLYSESVLWHLFIQYLRYGTLVGIC